MHVFSVFFLIPPLFPPPNPSIFHMENIKLPCYLVASISRCCTGKTRPLARWKCRAQILMRAKITIPGTSESFLRVSHVTRTRRVHQVSAVALCILNCRAWDHYWEREDSDRERSLYFESVCSFFTKIIFHSVPLCPTRIGLLVPCHRPQYHGPHELCKTDSGSLEGHGWTSWKSARSSQTVSRSWIHGTQVKNPHRL